MIELNGLGLTRETATLLRDYIGTEDGHGGRYRTLFNHLNTKLNGCCEGAATGTEGCCGQCRMDIDDYGNLRQRAT